ncbi:MAG: hypothetical protein ACKO23_20380 [Gemmataceae bacterium]
MLQFIHVAILLRSIKCSLFQSNTVKEVLAMTEQLEKLSSHGPGLLKPVPQLALGEANRRHLENLATQFDNLVTIKAVLAQGA